MKLIVLALALSVTCALDIQPSCHKPVYCGSKLLHYMQMARVFPNSKAFVDLHMKYDEKNILSSFELLLNETHNEPTKQQLEKFVENNFDLVDELENWTPLDFNKEPSFLYRIKDINLRQFAKDINNIWLTLGRKVKSVVFEKPESFSLIPVHHGFMLPGDRFKEFYYWDTYWIVEGLLVSGMKDTVKGIISNLIEMQRQFGHIPSGSRYYYQDRSQPPLLSAMMKLYIEATHDVEFLKANIDSLVGELQYWLDTQSITFNKEDKEHTLLRYYAISEGPRPESYYEDYTQAQKFDTDELKNQFYINIKSAAESGWDFSSRWFINKDGSNVGNLTSISTSHIIPVDLNAIFVNSLQNVAYFYGLLHNPRKAAHWAHIAHGWRRSIQEVLWNDEDGIWYDWDLSNEHHRKYFYPSNIAPLWMDVVDSAHIKNKGYQILEYMNKTQSLNFPGGVPASLIRSGHRWDFPNAFAPLVSIIVKSLEALQMEESRKMASDVVQSWVRSNYKAYVTSKKLLEKYNVEHPGKVENEEHYLLAGYGWTIGVVLQMLAKYETLTVQEGYYDFNLYKKDPTFWHIPTSPFLPLEYKSASHKTAPVLTQSLSSYDYFNHLTSASGQLINVPSVLSDIDNAPNKYIQSIVPSSSAPYKSQYADNSLDQGHIQSAQILESAQRESILGVPVKSEINSPKPILSEPVAPESIKLGHVQYNQSAQISQNSDNVVSSASVPILPEHIPVKPVKLDHEEYSHSVQASIQHDPIVSVPLKPEHLPLKPVKQEQVSLAATTPGYVEYGQSSVPVKPEFHPMKPILPEYNSLGQIKPEHVAYSYSEQASIQNYQNPVKPDNLPLQPVQQEQVPLEHNKFGNIAYGQSVEISSTSGHFPLKPVQPELVGHNPSVQIVSDSVQIKPISPVSLAPEYITSKPLQPILGQTLPPVLADSEHIQTHQSSEPGKIGSVTSPLAAVSLNKDLSVTKNQEIHFSGGSSQVPIITAPSLSANQQQAQSVIAGSQVGWAEVVSSQPVLATFAHGQSGYSGSQPAPTSYAVSAPSQSISTPSLSVSGPAQEGSVGLESTYSGSVLSTKAQTGFSISPSLDVYAPPTKAVPVPILTGSVVSGTAQAESAGYSKSFTSSSNSVSTYTQTGLIKQTDYSV